MAKPALRKKSPYPPRRGNSNTTAAGSQTGEEGPSPSHPHSSSSSSDVQQRPYPRSSYTTREQGEEAAASSQCSGSSCPSSPPLSSPLDSCSRRSSSDCSTAGNCPDSQEAEAAFDNLLKDLREDLGLDKSAIQDIRIRLASASITDINDLRSAVRQRRLCGLLHPYITEALCARLTGEPLPLFDLGEYSEARTKIRNPAKFHHGAIFVHRVAPVPGTRKGKIAVTWAFDMDLKETTVAELLQRLETLLRDIPVDRMRLVFNGFTLAATSSLASYDITEGDTLYLYTLRDPRAQTAYVCSTSPSPPAIVTAPPPPGGCLLPAETRTTDTSVGMPGTSSSLSYSRTISPASPSPFSTITLNPSHVTSSSTTCPASSPPLAGVCTPGGLVAATPAIVQPHNWPSGGTVLAPQPGRGGGGGMAGQCAAGSPAVIHHTMMPPHQHATHTAVTRTSSPSSLWEGVSVSQAPYGTVIGVGGCAPSRPPHPGDPPVYMSLASAPQGIHVMPHPTHAHCACSGGTGGGCYVTSPPATLSFTPTTTIVSPASNPQAITTMLQPQPAGPGHQPCPHMIIGGTGGSSGGCAGGGGGGSSSLSWIGPKATRDTCRIAQPYVRTMEVCSCGACAGFQYAPVRSTSQPAPCTVPGGGGGTYTYTAAERREKRRDSSDKSVPDAQ